MRMTANPPTIMVNRLPPTIRKNAIHWPRLFSPPAPDPSVKPDRVAQFMERNNARTGLGLPAGEPNLQIA